MMARAMMERRRLTRATARTAQGKPMAGTRRRSMKVKMIPPILPPELAQPMAQGRLEGGNSVVTSAREGT